VSFAVFSPDGDRIVTASWDKTARIWDAATGVVLRELKGHDGAVFFAAFSPVSQHQMTKPPASGIFPLSKKARHSPWPAPGSATTAT
jgi:WD40 repeat protein